MHDSVLYTSVEKIDAWRSFRTVLCSANTKVSNKFIVHGLPYYIIDQWVLTQ